MFSVISTVRLDRGNWISYNKLPIYNFPFQIRIERSLNSKRVVILVLSQKGHCDQVHVQG